MYLVFTTDHTADKLIPIGDGSYLKLIECEEGYFCPANYKELVDAQEWSYTEAKTITPIEPNNI